MMDWSDAVKQIEGVVINGDRRSDRRYDIHLDLRWKLIRRRRVLDSGVGRTVDLSSGGILFDAGRQLPLGLNVEMAIAWPVLLRNVAPLQLIVSGRIVRAAANRTAVTMMQHEFRTCAVPASQRAAAGARERTPPSLLGDSGGLTASGKCR